MSQAPRQFSLPDTSHTLQFTRARPSHRAVADTSHRKLHELVPTSRCCVQLIDTMLDGPISRNCAARRAHSTGLSFFGPIQTANERGPRLLPRDQRPAAGPLKPIAAPLKLSGAGREAVFTPQVELVHSVCVLLWRVAGPPSDVAFAGRAQTNYRVPCSCCSSVGLPIFGSAGSSRETC